MLGEAASPLALLLLGASFNFDTVAKEKRNLTICLIGRLLIFPAVGLIGGALMGFTGVKLMTLVALFASPSAVTSFTMAQQMDSDYELAGNCVVFSSAISCFTMFMWIFVLKSMGLF
jgi:predicted permease